MQISAKAAFDELQKKADALNEKVDKDRGDVADNEALEIRIDNFVANINKIVAEANNPANAPNIRDQLKAEITQHQSELDQMKQLHSDTHDRIVEDQASIESERDEVKSENDELNTKFDAEARTLADEKESTTGWHPHDRFGVNSGLREVRARSRKALPSRRVADVREAA